MKLCTYIVLGHDLLLLMKLNCCLHCLCVNPQSTLLPALTLTIVSIVTCMKRCTHMVLAII
jgi:hypothetical protein